MESIKCVIVGDGAVGKTSMLISYTSDQFPEKYVPTVFETYQATVIVGDCTTMLGLWDTAGQEEYDHLRPLAYQHADVFVVCYSITSPSSLDNVGGRWIPEIRSHSPDKPFLLVGTKLDVRDDPAEQQKIRGKGGDVTLVDREVVAEKCHELGAARNLECSAKTQKGLENVFHQAITVALMARANKKRKKRGCVLL